MFGMQRKALINSTKKNICVYERLLGSLGKSNQMANKSPINFMARNIYLPIHLYYAFQNYIQEINICILLE